VLVLLVEDHFDTRNLYATFLSANGFVVETAATGAQALAKAALVEPDVIIMDLGLPVMDGWETARHLRTSIHTRTIPIVAMSAHVSDHDQGRAMGAGCRAFLSKPCEPTRLLEVIGQVTRGRNFTGRS